MTDQERSNAAEEASLAVLLAKWQGDKFIGVAEDDEDEEEEEEDA
jgi:hypothetical protein